MKQATISHKGYDYQLYGIQHVCYGSDYSDAQYYLELKEVYLDNKGVTRLIKSKAWNYLENELNQSNLL